MEQTILRSKVYELLHSGAPFDMEFITCNRKKGTGGELITCEGWMKVGGGQQSSVSHQQPSVATENTTKNPHHGANGTINVFNPANAGVHPITVHYDLIQFFNGKRVIN